MRRRVEEAKSIMEAQMMAELERQREAELKLQQQREVESSTTIWIKVLFLYFSPCKPLFLASFLHTRLMVRCPDLRGLGSARFNKLIYILALDMTGLAGD